jgi:RecA/RadA recombinase
MAHELEYVVKGALMMCDKGAAPGFFLPTYNMKTRINGCLVTTRMDRFPIVNIPSFGICAATQKACLPVPTEWQKTYKVKVQGMETLLFRSCMQCGLGGKIEFVTSGQIPLPPDALEDIKKMQEEGRKKEEEGWGWLDTLELVPVIGSIVGAVREGIKGNWGMMAANIGFLALDVAGLFSFGATTAASTAVKAAAKTGVKVAAKTAAKSAAKQVGKSGLKTGVKLTSKGAAKTFKSNIDNVITKTAHGKVSVYACFPAGTPVHTESGVRSIEDIRVGDKVWSYNEDTGETALKDVLQVTEKEADVTLKLKIDGEEIETTAEHPFYTQDGWKDAADLRTSDALQTKDGGKKQINSITYSYQSKKVFNFAVADWHTYFVGLWAWLVHNAKCISGAVKKISDRLKYLGRTPGKNSKTGREVFERMLKEEPPTARITKVQGKDVKEFWDTNNKVWRNIKEADMGHIEDAVTWWNKTGRQFGAKSQEVREWMLDSKNYALEYYKTNRSKGAILGKTETYLPPLK